MVEFEKAFQLVQLLTSIVDTVVFCSVLNFSPVEAHRSLKQGGMLRICLRLVTCCSTIKCLKKRAEREGCQENIPVESLVEEINSKLTPLGIVGEPLRQVYKLSFSVCHPNYEFYPYFFFSLSFILSVSHTISISHSLFLSITQPLSHCLSLSILVLT